MIRFFSLFGSVVPSVFVPIVYAGKSVWRRMLLILFFCLLSSGYYVAYGNIGMDSVPVNADVELIQERESLFPAGNRPLWLSHFTWGVDVGTSIDLRGYDMSTLDADVMIGYKSDFIRTLGVGAGVHRSFGRKNNFFPLYVVFRSSFRSRPSLCFFNLRAGYAFSAIDNGASRGGAMAAVGVGINLAMSKRFQSHILLSYCYYHINNRTRGEAGIGVRYIDLARISFGVNF